VRAILSVPPSEAVPGQDDGAPLSEAQLTTLSGRLTRRSRVDPVHLGLGPPTPERPAPSSRKARAIGQLLDGELSRHRPERPHRHPQGGQV